MHLYTMHGPALASAGDADLLEDMHPRFDVRKTVGVAAQSSADAMLGAFERYHYDRFLRSPEVMRATLTVGRWVTDVVATRSPSTPDGARLLLDLLYSVTHAPPDAGLVHFAQLRFPGNHGDWLNIHGRVGDACAGEVLVTHAPYDGIHVDIFGRPDPSPAALQAVASMLAARCRASWDVPDAPREQRVALWDEIARFGLAVVERALVAGMTLTLTPEAGANAESTLIAMFAPSCEHALDHGRWLLGGEGAQLARHRELAETLRALEYLVGLGATEDAMCWVALGHVKCFRNEEPMPAAEWDGLFLVWGAEAVDVYVVETKEAESKHTITKNKKATMKQLTDSMALVFGESVVPRLLPQTTTTRFTAYAMVRLDNQAAS